MCNPTRKREEPLFRRGDLLIARRVQSESYLRRAIRRSPLQPRTVAQSIARHCGYRGYRGHRGRSGDRPYNREPWRRALLAIAGIAGIAGDQEIAPTTVNRGAEHCSPSRTLRASRAIRRSPLQPRTVAQSIARHCRHRGRCGHCGEQCSPLRVPRQTDCFLFLFPVPCHGEQCSPLRKAVASCLSHCGTSAGYVTSSARHPVGKHYTQRTRAGGASVLL